MRAGARLALSAWLLLGAGCGMLGFSSASVAHSRAEVERVRGSVSALRQMPWKEPVEIVFRAGLPGDKGGSDSEAKANAQAGSYALLGLLPPHAVRGDEGISFLKSARDTVSRSLAAYYDSKRRQIVLRPIGLTGGDNEEHTLAHELAHALDDQYTPLDPLIEATNSFDEMVALRCAVEGAAEMTASMHIVEQMRSEQNARAARKRLERLQAQMESDGADTAVAMEEAPPLLSGLFFAPYLLGVQFYAAPEISGMAMLDRAMTGAPQEFNQRVTTLLTQPPRSSEQILHPMKYWDAAQRDEPSRPEVKAVRDTFGKGWELVHHDSLGELGISLVLGEDLPLDIRAASNPGVSLADYSRPASAGWGGDHFAYLTGPFGEQAVFWWTYWDTPADRDEFLTAARERLPGLTPYFRGADATASRFAALYFSREPDDLLLERMKAAAMVAPVLLAR